MQPTPIFLPGESHRQRRLVACSPWGLRRVRHNLATDNNDSRTQRDSDTVLPLDLNCFSVYPLPSLQDSQRAWTVDLEHGFLGPRYTGRGLAHSRHACFLTFPLPTCLLHLPWPREGQKASEAIWLNLCPLSLPRGQ